MGGLLQVPGLGLWKPLELELQMWQQLRATLPEQVKETRSMMNRIEERLHGNHESEGVGQTAIFSNNSAAVSERSSTSATNFCVPLVGSVMGIRFTDRSPVSKMTELQLTP